MRTLVFDIGGENARAALSDSKGENLVRFAWRGTGSLNAEANPIQAFEAMLRDISEELGASMVARICLGVPGPVHDGIVRRLPTILGESVVNFDVVEMARRLWPKSAIWVCNELTSAGFEKVGSGWSDFLVITLGSGIGSKIFINGHPMLGERGFGGEIGHWRVPGAPEIRCDCGGRGHFAGLASGRGALQYLRYQAEHQLATYSRSGLGRDCPRPSDISSFQIVKHFLEGDDWTMAAMDKVAKIVGDAFGLLHLSVGIEKFFVTGGFGSALGSTFGQIIARHAEAGTWSTGIDWRSAVEIVDPKTEIGLLGALQYVTRVAPDFAATELSDKCN